MQVVMFFLSIIMHSGVQVSATSKDSSIAPWNAKDGRQAS